MKESATSEIATMPMASASGAAGPVACTTKVMLNAAVTVGATTESDRPTASGSLKRETKLVMPSFRWRRPPLDPTMSPHLKGRHFRVAPWQDRLSRLRANRVRGRRGREVTITVEGERYMSKHEPDRGAEAGRAGKGQAGDRSTQGDSTQAVWSAEEGPFPFGAAVVPIVSSATFAYSDLDTWREVATGRAAGHIYSRNSNPTVAVLEAKMAALDGTERAAAFSTGMAAISSALFALLSPGDRVVSIKDSYGGTNLLFEKFLPRFKIEATLCETGEHEAMEAEIARGCSLVYLETPTNPTLKVVDIARLAAAAKRAGAVVVADNTFATPVNQKPAALGADLVIHSATKFLAGHSDTLGGVVSGRAGLVARFIIFARSPAPRCTPTRPTTSCEA